MASQFDKMTAQGDAENVEAEEYTPSVIFTADATPDLSTMQIPRLRLAQGLTPEVSERRAAIGDYVLTNFPAHTEVELVPLLCQPIRSYKPDPRGQAQCHAPTGVFGVGNPGGVCAECPLSKWGPRNEKTGKAVPPVCKDGVVMRAYSMTHRSLVDFYFQGRNTSKGSFIMSQAMGLGYGNFVIRMRSSTAKNDKGQWCEPEIEMLGEVPADHKELTARWFDAIQKSLRQVNTADALVELREKANASS